MIEQTTYTVQDILQAHCNLEPLRCVHCNHVGEVVFSSLVNDGRCQVCGVWQISKEQD